MNQRTSLPILRKLSSKGKMLEWTISVVVDENGAGYETVHGQQDGKKQTDMVYVQGLNIGKKNETTPLEQATKDAQSIWNKKVRTGYSQTLIDATEVMGGIQFKPMLAHTWKDQSKKAVFPGYVQPKLDGCLTGDALIKTKEYGYKTIKWLVDNKIFCKVWSKDRNGNLEYRLIKHHFLNKQVDEKTEWFEIVLETGEKLILTGNHEVYLPELDCWRRTDELTGKEKLMVL